MDDNPPVIVFAAKAIRYAGGVVCMGTILAFSAACALMEGHGCTSVSYEAVLASPYRVTITPSKTAGYPGERVKARLTIKNIGTQQLWVPVPLSQCRLDVQFAPVDEIAIDDPFVLPRLTCRRLKPGAEISVEREFVVPDTTSRCEFFTGYSGMRANTVSFAVLHSPRTAAAKGIHKLSSAVLFHPPYFAFSA